ncbi:MAG TPA: TetR/AcrR family transcriptional regulator [Solirubrobacteraceae bacterium]|nr:TetR/AcrR family transcriptional regulator [Solirubrobacteraceae bacterium]
MPQARRGPLYKRLPHGPQGLDRETVARHQRVRLYGAMIEAVASDGYAGTSVSQLIELAGVSRRTFYELFANKQECFLATYDIIAARGIKRVTEAYRTTPGWLERLQAAFAAFAAEIEDNPNAAKLAIVEALGAGAPAMLRMQRAVEIFERMVGASFERSPGGVALPAPIIKGIVGGVRRVAFLCLRSGHIEQLRGLDGQLLSCVLSYHSPAAHKLSSTPVRAPEQTPGESSLFGAQDDRTRVLRAVVQLSASDGYPELTVPQIADGAGVTVEEFCRMFPNPEQCFLAALEAIGDETLRAAGREASGAASWQQAVYRGIEALMRHLAVRPQFARVGFIEIFAVGPASIDRGTALVRDFSRLLAEQTPHFGHVPNVAPEAIAGGAWQMIHHYVAHDQIERLPELTDYIAYIALAPFMGANHAVELILRERAVLAA